MAPRPLTEGLALSNSFGFGGHNVTLAFRSA
jgi:3-oxoacyl-(acyl-carrier-protein) synthase